MEKEEVEGGDLGEVRGVDLEEAGEKEPREVMEVGLVKEATEEVTGAVEEEEVKVEALEEVVVEMEVEGALEVAVRGLEGVVMVEVMEEDLEVVMEGVRGWEEVSEGQEEAWEDLVVAAGLEVWGVYLGNEVVEDLVA